MLRVSCLKLEIKEVRCYEAKIEESEKGQQYIQRIVRVGGCPAVVAQWQSTGGSSQRCPGFDSRRLPAFFTFLYFRLITSNFLYFQA